jgi:hypothetical protein
VRSTTASTRLTKSGCGAFGDLGLHVGVEKAQSVAPRPLGLVHRQVGPLQLLAHVGMLVVEERNANAGRAEMDGASQQVRPVKRSKDLFAHTPCPGGGFMRILAQVFDHHQEFIAAKARHRVAGAHAGQHALPDLPQQLVALLVAERVVQGLEVVQVDEQQGAAGPGARAHRKGMLEPVQQQLALGESGQPIVQRQVPDFVLVRLALADVGEGHHATDDAAVFNHRICYVPDRKRGAILAPKDLVVAMAGTAALGGLADRALLARRSFHEEQPEPSSCRGTPNRVWMPPPQRMSSDSRSQSHKTAVTAFSRCPSVSAVSRAACSKRMH